MTGLVIIVFFLLIAALAPILGTNDPIAATVGAPFDVPAWSTIFPTYSKLPVDQHPINSTFATAADTGSWTWSGTINKSVEPIPTGGPIGYSTAVLVNSTVSPTANQTNDPFLPGGTAFFTMSRTFQFTGNAPATFQATAVLQPIEMQNVSTVYVKMMIIDPKGNNYSLSSTQLSALNFEIAIPSSGNGVWKEVVVSSGLLPLSGIPVYHNITNPPAVIFTQPGTYNFTMQIQGVVAPNATAPSINMRVAFVGLYLRGSAYGVLGTDNFGRDVWSQFVWGSQISLLIGVLSGIGAVALGAIVGIAGGYLGGNWDEIIGRITDFFLVLPFLPLLIIVVTLLVGNAALYRTIYVWVILIFVILSWPGIAKIIRAQVLSVKERAYVEASRALGSDTGHVLRKHILPNVMGLVYSQVALNVGGFILLEAALDFLAISVHGVRTITWGLMLTYSLPYAVHNPNLSYVWWWFLPPGIAIALLSLAFVLVGFALDSIFNPRLRQR